MNQLLKLLKELLPYIIIIIVVIIIRTFIFTPVVVNGPSMMNTLHNGDVMILDKIGMKLGGIKRFDIVVIQTGKTKIIKRVIGIPEDKVVIKDNYVFVNDIKYDDFITTFAGILDKEIILGDDEYIVLGDNRKESIDSRYEEIGIIKKDEIIGKIYN